MRCSAWRGPVLRRPPQASPASAEPALCVARLVQLRIDVARGPRWDARDPLELLLSRVEYRLRGAEVPQQRAPPRRADAVEAVEDRLARLRVAPAAMEAEREAVRLVADPLEQLQPRGGPVEPDRVCAAGQVHLFLPLRERDHGDARKVECLH